MAIQFTPEEEQRLQAIVKAGGYPSVGEALTSQGARRPLVSPLLRPRRRITRTKFSFERP
jgi:hypothetical protein